MAPTRKSSRRGAGGSNGTYEVGYGRPPKATQFRKGTSGNPGGKKKPGKPVTSKSLLHATLMRTVTIMDDGVPRTVPVLELAYISLARDAAKGDVRAFKLVSEELKRHPLPAEIEEADPRDYGAEIRQKLEKMAECMEANSIAEARAEAAKKEEAEARARAENDASWTASRDRNGGGSGP